MTSLEEFQGLHLTCEEREDHEEKRNPGHD
jgi:hypothetical protein